MTNTELFWKCYEQGLRIREISFSKNAQTEAEKNMPYAEWSPITPWFEDKVTQEGEFKYFVTVLHVSGNEYWSFYFVEDGKLVPAALTSSTIEDLREKMELSITTKPIYARVGTLHHLITYDSQTKKFVIEKDLPKERQLEN